MNRRIDTVNRWYESIVEHIPSARDSDKDELYGALDTMYEDAESQFGRAQAVIEAARAIAGPDHSLLISPEGVPFCALCGGGPGRHHEACRWDALRRALEELDGG